MTWDAQTWLQAILAGANIAVMIALFWYAWETRGLRRGTDRLVIETQESRRALVRPRIEYHVKPRYEHDRGHFVEIWLSNAGLGIAEDVRICLKRRPGGAPPTSGEIVVPSQDPDTKAQWLDRYPLLYPSRESRTWTLFQNSDEYIWQVFVQKERNTVYKYRLEGTYRDMLGGVADFRLFFDSEGNVLTEEQY